MYALYPFTVPLEIREVQRSLGHEAEFTYDPPAYSPPAKVITDSKIILSIMRDSTSYTLPCINATRQLGAYGNTLGGISPAAIRQKKILGQAILGPNDSKRDFAVFLKATTSGLLSTKSCKLFNVSEVEIAKHISPFSWTQLVAHLFYIPLKDAQNPKASFDCKQLHECLMLIFQYFHHDEQPTRSASLTEAALRVIEVLMKELEDVCEALECSSFAHVLLHRNRRADQNESMTNHGDELLLRLFEGGKTIKEVVSLVMLLSVEIAVCGSLAVSYLACLFSNF